MDVLTPEVAHEDGVLTETAFTRLLEWLDDGTPTHGESYLHMRRRLVQYFDRRNRPFADELADDTLNRVGRTLERSGSISITPPARYCYVVARFVMLEDVRRGRRCVQVDDLSRTAEIHRQSAAHDGSRDVREQRLTCLDRCLETLKTEQRELVVEYYRDNKREKIERRRQIAARLGISMNALGIRASRIRATLETCVEGCARCG